MFSRFFYSHIVTHCERKYFVPCKFSLFDLARLGPALALVVVASFLNQRPAKENHHLLTRGQWRSPAQKSAGSYSHPWALRGIPNCVSIKKICGQGAVRTFPSTSLSRPTAS